MEKICILLFLLCSIASTECRQGWKTNQNGYFVYKASTNFSGTRNLQIKGKFSTVPNSQVDNVLIAAEDALGNFTFQYSITQGRGKIVCRQGSLLQVSSSLVNGGSSGYLFSFTIDISETSSGNGTYRHTVNPSLSIAMTTTDNTKWNLDNITLYIGGYKKSIESGIYFEGCLSDFTFQGVDIISTYFQQYPNNTNPVKGALSAGSFSNVAQTCNDAMSTAPPTATATQIPPTTVSTATKNVASLTFLLLFALVILFL